MAAGQGIQTPIGRAATGGDVFDIADTTVEVSNSVSEVAAYQVAIPPNVLIPKRGVAVTMHGDYLNNTAGNATLTLIVQYGETELYRGESIAIPFDADLRSWFAQLRILPIQRLKSQRLFGAFKIGAAVAPTTGVGIPDAELFSGPISGSSSEDSALSQDLTFTLKHDTADAQIRWRRFLAYAEYIG